MGEQLRGSAVVIMGHDKGQNEGNAIYRGKERMNVRDGRLIQNKSELRRNRSSQKRGLDFGQKMTSAVDVLRFWFLQTIHVGSPIGR